MPLYEQAKPMIPFFVAFAFVEEKSISIQQVIVRLGLEIFGRKTVCDERLRVIGDPSTMIAVSNRVPVKDSHVETFVNRLRESHGIEEQPGFRGLKLLSPVDANTHITMTFWDSIEDYEAWREGHAFERAHSERSPDEIFEESNEVEVHEVTVERDP